jgi:hypothetical protein
LPTENGDELAAPKFPDMKGDMFSVPADIENVISEMK